MRRLLALTLLACFSSLALGQDKLPPRFDTFAKSGPFRLTRILGTPEIQLDGISASAFSHDGKFAVYVEVLSRGDEKTPNMHSRISVCDTSAKTWPREIEVAGKAITAFDISQDGRTILAAGLMSIPKEKDPRPFVSLWDLSAGKDKKTILLKGKAETPFLARLSSDGANALIGSGSSLRQVTFDSGTVGVLETYGPAAMHELVSDLGYLPDGKQFITLFGHGVRLWDTNKKKPVRTFDAKKTKGPPYLLSISPDGKRFATAHGFTNTTLMIWETASGKLINEFQVKNAKDDNVPVAIALAPDGRTVLCLTERVPTPPPGDPLLRQTRLLAWNGETNKIVWSRFVPDYFYGHVRMLVNDEKILVGGGPNYLDTWSLKTGTLLSRQGAHKSAVNVVGVLQNGDILSGDANGMLITWREGAPAGRSLIHKGAITAFAFSKDGFHYATAGADQQIYDWPLSAAKKKELPMNHTGPITSLAYSASGNWIASGSGDRTAKTWDLGTREEIATFAGHSAAVNAVAISPDDRWLATGSDDATIKVWPIKNGKLDPDRDTITLEKHTKAITCLTFTPDGKRLISGSQDQKLLVWDWQKGRMDFMIVGHKNWINSILLLDAKTVLTASDDLSVCAWNLADGMELGQIDFGPVGDCPRCLAKIGPDRFAVGSSNWLIYEFQLTKSKEGNGSSKK